MIIKIRKESNELILYRLLNSRMLLSDKEKQYLLNLEKGYWGEVNFDELIDHLPNQWLILNDLQLDINNNFIQIDKIAITPNKILIFEVKNYEGDFIIEGTKWCIVNNNEIKNPLNQLDRGTSSIRRLIHELGFNTPVYPYLIFINPEFQLYNAPLNLPIIYPTQLNRFVKQLSTHSQKLKEKHFKLAEKFAALHVKENIYTKLPKYNYEQLKKGITCKQCGSFVSEENNHQYVLCKFCGHKEKRNSAILRSINEFKQLFPELKITKAIIHDWCQVINSRHIQYILSNHYTLKQHGRASYYI